MDGKMDKETIEYLLGIGALEFCFVDENGEDVYKMTKEAATLVPEIYGEYMKNFNYLIFSLWNKDLIDVVFDESGEPLIGVNENTYNEELRLDISQEEREVLEEIIYTWKEKEE
jgi:hypothetical protein